MTDDRRLTIGFARMYNEPGERRAFLPPLMGLLGSLGVDVYVEAGSGAGMGYADDAYLAASPRVHIVDEATAYRQDIVVVLRAPEGRYQLLRPGAILLSMLHFTTRPERVELLRGLGIEAIALDMVTGDDGRRLVQNLRFVARNGLGAAFDALERRWPPLLSPSRPAVSVTILGAGGVGKHAIEWASKAGGEARNQRFMREGLPGVEVVVAEQNLAGNEAYFRHRLALTDILVDATARRDTSRPLFPNAWLGWLPDHAVVCDLAVDPYLLDDDPPVVRGIEGIPQGNLDQWEFGPDDPAWDRLPPGIPTSQRRTVVSCYSWPGVQPEACMEAYGSQVTPLLKTLIWYGGLPAIGPSVSFHGRALWRASLRHWLEDGPAA
ncbi:MAG: Rossmann-fold NAD(P)-binding domain-containing protein [Candidatus Limnocylindrales bacterium]